MIAALTALLPFYLPFTLFLALFTPYSYALIADPQAGSICHKLFQTEGEMVCSVRSNGVGFLG